MSILSELAISVLSASLVGLGSVVSFCETASALNERPFVDFVPVHLQDELNKVTGADRNAPIFDAIQHQKPFDLFTNNSDKISLNILLYEPAGFAPENVFGIYQVGNPDFRVPLFIGDNDLGDLASVFFHEDESISVSTQSLPPDMPPVANSNFQLFPDFGDTFGFYLDTPAGDNLINPTDIVFFSEDRLNPGGNPQALIFQGDGQTILQIPGHQPSVFSDDKFIVSFEDLPASLTFQDMGVIVSGITPKKTPEPSTIIGLFITLCFGGLLKRVPLERKKSPAYSKRRSVSIL